MLDTWITKQLRMSVIRDMSSLSVTGARGKPRIESEMNTAGILMRSRPTAYPLNPEEGSAGRSGLVRWRDCTFVIATLGLEAPRKRDTHVRHHE